MYRRTGNLCKSFSFFFESQTIAGVKLPSNPAYKLGLEPQPEILKKFCEETLRRQRRIQRKIRMARIDLRHCTQNTITIVLFCFPQTRGKSSN